MIGKTYIFNPCAYNKDNAIRGIGRYTKVLLENLSNSEIVDNINKISQKDVFINPYLNLFNKPLKLPRAKKNILVLHDLIPLKYPQHFPVGLKGKINYLHNKVAIRGYDHIVTDSIASKSDIENILKIEKNKISVIYPLVAKIFTENSPQKVNLSLPDNYFVYVGDVNWHKNLVNLAKAISLVQIPCVCVGKAFTYRNENLKHPWQSEFRKFLEIVRLNPKLFIFPGFVSNDELKYIYRNAIANVLVSQDEGFGYSYVEASSQQTPSILSNINIFTEISNLNSIYVQQNSYKDIAEKMLLIKDNLQLREKLIKENYANFLKINDQNIFKRKWEQVINCL